ncbi:MAG: tetratricopeptide repeat protein [Caulobacterales bacterium]|jgi:putative thioredoxin
MPTPAPTDPSIKDGSDKTFMADVIEASRTNPVIVDFWAPWCGPCKQLSPPLERAVTAAKGKVKLVKINIDENPAIAGQLGVRSIPAVYAFDRGRPVDGFVGLLPESQLKMFVDRLAGGGADAGGDDDVAAFLAQADESLGLGDIGGAAQAFATVLTIDPENVKAIAGLARCYLASGDPERAGETLDMAPDEKKNAPEIVSVRTALELAAQAADAGDVAPLLAAVQKNPDDLQARFDLANAFVARGDLEKAVDHLLALIEKDRAWNEEAARKQLLKVFEAAGPTSDIAKSGRRRLSAVLFS